MAQARVAAVPVAAGLGQRPLDELRLPALPPRGDDVAPRGPVGDLAAVVAAHEVQQQVDARGVAGRGEHVAVVDEQHPGVEPDGGVEPAEGVGVHPVRGGGPVVEQPGGGEHERAGADGHQAGAAGGRRRAAARASSSGSRPSVIAGPPYTPGTTTVCAVASAEASCSGSTLKPAEVRTGPPSRVATRTR